MSLDSLNEHIPRHFGHFQRLIGYLILLLLLVVYSYQHIHVFQVIILLFFIVLVLFSGKIEAWLNRYYPSKVTQHGFFIIDAMAVALTLAGVNLSLVITFLVLFGLIYSVINTRTPIFILSLGVILALLTFYLSSISLFGHHDYFQPTSQELTVISLLCLITFINIGNYYQHKRIATLKQSRQYYYNQMTRYMAFANQLSRYAPLQLWQSIMRGDAEAKIEYKRQKMTIFFSDIEGFTELSEKLIPDDLAYVLNDYLSHMTEIAKQYEGTIDKFMGDAILIFFGAPHTQGVEEDAVRCVNMALAMRQEMQLLRERWLKMGYPSLNIRMGISTGYCHVGNYGAHHRMSYTIVGHDANLAARLQTAAEVNEILISAETHRCVQNQFLCVPKPPMQLKGIQDDVQAWQVVERLPLEEGNHKQWFDFNYQGFHLVLNLDEVRHYEYPELLEVLEKMVERMRLQQSLTSPSGAARLSLNDQIQSEH